MQKIDMQPHNEKMSTELKYFNRKRTSIYILFNFMFYIIDKTLA